MGERIYHGAHSCSGTNFRKCQDLGDSILLILGTFILLNVGINVLWKHLKGSLRILFHHYFPKDTKNLYSRIPARFHHRPSFLPGHVNHLDSWIPDTNDENISRCCWMPPQCGHGRAPIEAPWELWKGGLMGAGEGPQATAMKTQASSFARPEVSPQIPKISKLNMGPSSSPQDKTKAPVGSPSHPPAQALTYTSTNTHEHPSTQSQTQTSEHSDFRAQGVKHTSAHAPPSRESDFVPALSEVPKPAKSSSPTSSRQPTPIPPYPPIQAPNHSQSHALGQAKSRTLPSSPRQVPAPTPAQGLAHSPKQNSVRTSRQPPTKSPAFAPFQSQVHNPVRVPVHALTHSQADVPKETSQVLGHAPRHSPIHLYARTSVPNPTSAPAPAPTFTPATCVLAPIPTCAPAPALALSMTMTTPTPAQVPTTTSTPILSAVPSVVATFGPSFSTGHMVYDARRVKQNTFPKPSSQDSRYFRKDLNILSRPQEVTGLMNSGSAEQTPKQHSGDSAEPPSGSMLGYLELGNMEWKISENAKDKFSQPKTFPYSNVHPCCSERKTEAAQAPLYHQYLVYAQDAMPSKPCLHSPSTTQSTLPTVPPPCTLSLPLVSPRTFAVSQSNHQKLSNLTQAPSFLSTPNSPQTASSSHFSIPSQFSISQSLTQPPNPENQNLNQGLGLQKAPSLSKDSGVPKKTGFTQDTGLRKNPSLTPNPGLQKNPGLTQDPGLHKNPSLTPNPGLQKNPGLTQDSSLHKNPGLTLTPGVNKNLGFYKFPNHTQDLYLCMHPNSSQDSCLQKNLDISQDSGLRSPAAIQDASILRNHPALGATSGQRTLSFMQDSLVYRNAPLNQDTVINKNKDPSLGTNYKRPDPCQDSGGGNVQENVQHPEVCRNVSLTQDSRPQKNRRHTEESEVNKSSGLTQESGPHKSLGLAQTSCLHKSSGLTQDSGDYKNLGLIQDSGICRVPDLNQDSDSYKSSSLVNATETEKRSDLNQDVSIYSSEHSQSSNLQESPATERDPCPHQDPALGQGSSFKPPDLTQQANPCKDSGLILDPGLTKRLSYVPESVGTDSTQISGSLQTVMLTPSPVKPFVCKMASQKDNTEQHLPWTSVPVNQNSCPSKAQVISADLKTFSEVPVLIELQSPSRRLDSQDWVYHPADPGPPACQKYRQMSMPPKINWKPHCPGPGTRSGHVVFDSRQKPLVTGREKCEALSSRRFRQETPRNSEETQKEWGYQNVMRTLNKEGTNTRRE
ncbi:SPEM family member 3 [Apodemus speciosus]|uniref:SPEM family member 3 n=1 Tax=Apodemus speciosus TaxID=105296 RepID=A0ABQ0FAN3_APOSI